MHGFRDFTPAAIVLLSAALSGCASTGEGLAELPSGDLIHFRLVQETPAPGLETRSLDGETLHLEPQVIAADAELSRPRLVMRDGEWTLDIRFTVDGGVALDRALLGHSGRRLALLVDSRVRYVTDARSQLGASRILVPLRISDAEAARLEEAIRSRWPEDDS